MASKIHLVHSRPYYPQSQGKIEVTALFGSCAMFKMEYDSLKMGRKHWLDTRVF